MTEALHYYQASWLPRKPRDLKADVVVYGATSAGVIAAVRARLSGKSAILLNPGRHLGGMTSSGLGYTDLGNPRTIGGLARKFYRDVGALYGMAECWKFEPHKALAVFMGYLAEYGIEYVPDSWLDGVDMDGRKIVRVYLRGGSTVGGSLFMDTSYEGDLMALSGVPWTMGREPNGLYGETLNGQQIHETHQFDAAVDPYAREGDPSSGLLPSVEGEPYRPGAGDRRVQAYNFRVCMTDDPALRVPFPKPLGFREERYELLARFLERTGTNHFQKFDRITPASKTDTNNHGAVSTDYIGGNRGWVTGSPEERELIFQDHVSYQQGLHWYMANGDRVPSSLRSEYGRWGLAGDEFPETGGWPPQLYVREARRMLGDYVITEKDCRGAARAPDSVGMAAYQMDSHNVRRIAADNRVRNEGDVQFRLERPYPLSYRALVPPRSCVGNLLVPVCLSASHIAFGSVRMEPVFMLLADSAAQAGCLALDRKVSVQEIPYAELEKSLLAAEQVLASDARNEGDGNPGYDA